MEPIELTEAEKAANYLIAKLAVIKPNCYQCAFFQRSTDNLFYGTCNADVAVGIKALGSTLHKAYQADPHKPLFPLITMNDGTQFPGLIALEFGVNAGLVRWPFRFDPLYILFCIFHLPKDLLGTSGKEDCPIDTVQ